MKERRPQTHQCSPLRAEYSPFCPLPAKRSCCLMCERGDCMCSLVNPPSEPTRLFLNSYPDSAHLLSTLMLRKSPALYVFSAKGGGWHFCLACKLLWARKEGFLQTATAIMMVLTPDCTAACWVKVLITSNIMLNLKLPQLY